MNEINEVTMHATMQAHKDGGVPIIHLKVGKHDAYHIGYLIHFFEASLCDERILIRRQSI